MKPTKKFSAGAISAIVWTNPAKNSEGEYKTVSIERSYKDIEGNWKSTTTLRVTDLPKVSLVLGKAYEFLSLKEEI